MVREPDPCQYWNSHLKNSLMGPFPSGKAADSLNCVEVRCWHHRPLHTSGWYQVVSVELKIVKKNVHVTVQNGTKKKWSRLPNHLLPDLFIFFSSFTYFCEKLKRCFAGMHEKLLGFIAWCQGSWWYNMTPISVAYYYWMHNGNVFLNPISYIRDREEIVSCLGWAWADVSHPILWSTIS